MKKILTICGILTLLVTAGCEKVLEKTPEDGISTSNYFTKESHAILALNGVIDMLGDRNFYGGTYQYRMLAGDDLFSVLDGAAGDFPANNKHHANTALVLNVWRILFTTIERANILLANLDKIPMDESRKGVIRGEALFLRAYAMFMAVDLWGPIPINTAPTGGPNDIARARQPIKDVYAQILSDMTEAEKLVPTTAVAGYGGAGYPAKTTVQGILARVCLTMAGEPLKDISKYQDAKNWAMKVVNSGEHRLNPDYADIFIKLASDQYDPKETMWELDFKSEQGVDNYGQFGYLGGIQGTKKPFAIPTANQYRVIRAFFYAFEGGTSAAMSVAPSPDLRRDWVIAPFMYNGAGLQANKVYHTSQFNIVVRDDAKWRPRYEAGTQIDQRSGINFPLLRYSDVLLMAAEAENAINGPTPLAHDLVNQVRRRAYGVTEKGLTVHPVVTITNGGSGYTSAPTITFSGGGGTTQAKATATISGGRVTGINLVQTEDTFKEQMFYEGGSFYSSAPTITISGGGGSGAAATAKLISPDLSTTLDKMGFLKAVQDERYKELSSEALRRHDLIRWGIFESRLKEVADEVQNPAYAGSTNSGYRNIISGISDRTTAKHRLFPIPAAELSVNTAMTQNEGW